MFSRHYATAEPDLKTTLKEVIPAKRELLKKVKAQSEDVIGDVKVGNTIGGMRGLKAMLWEGSVLDADEGIRFHGKTIKDCQKELPKGTTGTEMLPEAMFWLLLTGQVPSTGQVRAFSRELAEKSELPTHILDLIKSFPSNMHPMTQLSIAVAALNTESKFAQAYEKGINKAEYWEPTFDDSISLLAKIPRVAALVSDRRRLMPLVRRSLTPPRIGPTTLLSCSARAVLNTATSMTSCVFTLHSTVTTRVATCLPMQLTSSAVL